MYYHPSPPLYLPADSISKIVTNPVIGHDHEWGKNQIVIMTNRGNPIKVCFCQQKRMSPPVPQTIVKGKKSI